MASQSSPALALRVQAFGRVLETVKDGLGSQLTDAEKEICILHRICTRDAVMSSTADELVAIGLSDAACAAILSAMQAEPGGCKTLLSNFPGK